jgi:iron complex outermembrane receptor protein
MKTKTVLLLALLAPLAPLAALAQTAPTARPPASPASTPVIALDKFEVEETRAYIPLSAGTASKSDTPVRDIPFAVSTVTRAVIEDQRSLMLGDLLRNVPGVTPQPDFGQLNSRYRIRGFVPSNQLKNGFRQQTFVPVTDLLNVAQVEVLKGPASALYGRFEPGGVVNIITKKPFDVPYARAELTVGSDSFYRGAIDVSGPVASGKSVRYRLNLAYEDTESYRDFFNKRTLFAAPVVEWRLSPDTKLTFEAEGGYVKPALIAASPSPPPPPSGSSSSRSPSTVTSASPPTTPSTKARSAA